MPKRRRTARTSLRKVEWKRFLRAPDSQLLDDLYVPALSRAVRYDRCCAYFSSSVLAVAARGFGGFIEKLIKRGDEMPRPAARLLVNEQLDAQDLDALLATGDEQKLIKKLLKQFKTPKDAVERDRLGMLAWLVASGWLEVRVGLMRRTHGLSHAKFGIVTDVHGDSVAFMGSDNETGEALVENYEELEVRPSWEDADFAAYYLERFDALWEDRDENVATLPLPDAVREKLIELAPDEPPTVEPRPDKQALATAMLWHFIAAAPYLPDGEYACDATAMVDLWPHQRRVVDEAANAFPAGRLLCDEVGMGKTIEAMLILRRLLCGRGVKRALLLVPAGLLKQWQDELREKGGLLVPRWENGYLYQPDGSRVPMKAPTVLADQDVLLLSREWARLEGNRDVVLSAPAWDMVLLDEAHAARRRSPDEREFNSGNLLLELLRDLQLRGRARGILLLSGTPMQTQPWEPWDLLALVGVGGEWIVEFDDIRRYYEGIARLTRGSLDKPTADTIARLVASDEEFPSLNGLRTRDPQALANALLFATGDRRQQYADWLRRSAPLGRRMHRNTRQTLRRYCENGLIDYALPTRKVQDEVFDYEEQGERECYEAVETYINKRYEEMEREKTGKGFVMTVYRRRAASSPLALRRSLERRLERLEKVIRKEWSTAYLSPEEEQVDSRDLSDAGMEDGIDPALPKTPKAARAEKEQVELLLGKLNALGPTDSKLAKFWQVLEEVTADGRSVLVFTEYTDTMEYLRDRLAPTYGPTLGCYCGEGGQVWDGTKWVTVSKADIAARLSSGELRVLVCTDAASEGLNLQAASAVINYDLPWNPSKVDQRIGRIDRIGQRQSLLPIRNLFLDDSVDMKVYQALRLRCGLFEQFVGPMQPVLAIARDALRRSLRVEDADDLIEDLEERARQVRADAAATNAFLESEAEELPSIEPPLDREDIETALRWLAESGGPVTARRTAGELQWRLRGLGRRAVEVTTDREVLERNDQVAPVSAGADVLQSVVDRLPMPNRAPLVLCAHSSGPFHCIEARWAGAQGTIRVRSAKRLAELVGSWDGTPAAPGLLVKARRAATSAARRRVQEMRRRHEAEESGGLQRQCEGARLRLMRELARTLLCTGTGDLNKLFRRQAERESSPDGRYHRALELLGGFPEWAPEDVAEAEAFVEKLRPQELQGRLTLASELEAALNDPRWRASCARGK